MGQNVAPANSENAPLGTQGRNFTPKVSQIRNFPVAPNVAPNVSENDGGWIEPGKKRKTKIKNNAPFVRKRKNEGIIGSSLNTCSLDRVPRRFHYKVGRLGLHTTEEDLENFVSKFVKCKVEVEHINLPYAKYYKLFRVSVPDTFDSIIMDGNNWPKDIRVARYYFRNDRSKVNTVNTVNLNPNDNM